MNGTRQMQRSGFSLIEMLVVIAILVILMGASLAGYSHVTKSAERAKAQELVSNVATALAVIYQNNGAWPKRLAANAGTDGRLDDKAALALTGALGLNTSGSGDNKKLIGHDRFGVVTPWAMNTIQNKGDSATEGTPVSSGGTIRDHVLHYAIDFDGDGVIKGASVGGVSVDVRASAIVWCCGRDGKVSAYQNGKTTKNCDDIYSWQPGQTRNVK